MENRRNSQALITSYIDKLRLALIDVSNNEANINRHQFSVAFLSIFNGIGSDAVSQIYDGFVASYDNTINCNLLLNDVRLPQILIILHNYSMSQITHFHRDIASKLLHHNNNNNNNNESDPNQQSLVVSLIQKLGHCFGEITNIPLINYNEFLVGFEKVFIGITTDIYQQIFDGFDVLQNGQIDYYEMLKNEKLPKILMLLHENAMTQISTLQTAKLSISKTHINININIKQEIKKLTQEIKDLKQDISDLNASSNKWRDKYENEIKQNKIFQMELETDLEEEYKTKLNQVVNEYDMKLNDNHQKYENMLNQSNIKYDNIIKDKEDEIQTEKQKYLHLLNQKQANNEQKRNGMFGVLFSLFNSTDTDLNNFIVTPQEMGVISLDILHTFHGYNSGRKLISIYGVIFDVTACDKYSKYGRYGDFTGHDISLCVIFNKYDKKWCDKFVQLNYKQIESVKQYIKKFKKEFVNVGKLKNYQEIQSNWPKLTHSELNELEDADDCLIM